MVDNSDALARRLKMADLFRGGLTFREIGIQFGISKQRVGQCLSAMGVSRTDGGEHIRIICREIEREKRRDDRCLILYGCTHAQYKSLKGRPYRRYRTQKGNATRRGIEWGFKLWDWWQVWEKSGKWRFRGIGQGYVMCRIGDVGPYSPDNVFIAPARINVSDTRRKKSGLPIGVRSEKSRAFTAVRQINGKRYRQSGFDTPKDAHAAYLRWGGE